MCFVLSQLIHKAIDFFKTTFHVNGIQCDILKIFVKSYFFCQIFITVMNFITMPLLRIFWFNYIKKISKS